MSISYDILRDTYLQDLIAALLMLVSHCGEKKGEWAYECSSP